MATKAAPRNRISRSRAARLYRLLQAVSSNTLTRATLTKRLKIGMRTFYRDLDFLRHCGIMIETRDDGYGLKGTVDAALEHLPFPDPEITFADVASLLKGRSDSHNRLRVLFEKVTK